LELGGLLLIPSDETLLHFDIYCSWFMKAADESLVQVDVVTLLLEVVTFDMDAVWVSPEKR
jgi:hypothetical protein